MEIIQNFSYLGLLLIIFIEETGIPLPIPGDLLIGAAAAIPNSNYFLIVLVVTFATLTGSTILFTLSRKFGYKLLTRYGKYINATPEKIDKVEKWFKKYGGTTIVMGRLIPGLRTITPFAAGLFRVDYKTFWFYTAIAAFIWASIYFIVGKFFYVVLAKLLILFH